MRIKTVCGHCNSNDIEYRGHDRCYCSECQQERDTREIVVESPFERTRRAVYATGNRWAIENFEATH